MLVVCIRKKLFGFTYGRIYRVTHVPFSCVNYSIEDKDSEYFWIIDNKGNTVGESKRDFQTIPQWKKSLDNRDAILWALTSGVL